MFRVLLDVLIRCKEMILLQLYCCCRQHYGNQIVAALAVMLLHATFWSAGFFMRRTVTYIKSYGLHTKMTIQAWPTGCRGESRIQTTSCVRPAAECTAHITFGRGSRIMATTILPAATLWLPQSCCQQYRGCHNLAPAARLKQGQQYCGSHDVADVKIVAATILLPLQILCPLHT